MREGYITGNALQGKGGQKKQREKEGRRLQFLGLLKALTVKHQRTEKKLRRRRIYPRTKPEDKLLPFLHAFDHSTSLRSCPAVVALTKAQFFSPFSLPNLLYRAYWVWVHLRLQ